MINKTLAISRGLDKKTINNIQVLQDLQEELISYASESDIEPLTLLEIYKDWFDIHRQLQKLWKFPQDDNYIKFWEFPKCTCPKLDNEDNYPKGYYTMNKNCIIHKNS